MAEPRHLVVQGVVDVNQRAGHVQQVVLVGRALPAGDAVDYLALFLDHAARSVQAQHAERLADAVQRFRLGLQAGHIGQAGAQVQVECVLDPQQVFLQCDRDGVQQGAVAPRQAAARMFEFCVAGLDQQARQRVLLHQCHAARRAQVVEQRQQHDRDVAVPTLQAFEVIRQLHHAAHQCRACVVAAGDAVRGKAFGELLHFLGHHRRGMQFQHPQGAAHLVQVASARTHALAVGRRFGEGLDLDPRLAQGLVDLRLHPAERSVVDGIPQRRGHRGARMGPRTEARLALAEVFIPTPVSCTQAGNLKSATERRRSAASCARLPIDSAVWLAPCEVCAVIDWMVLMAWVMLDAALDCSCAATEMP